MNHGMPDMHPADVASVCRAATALVAAGDAAGGARLLAGPLARRPHDPNLLYVAGNCALAEGDDSAAVSFYERSVAAAPTFVAALANLGFVLRKRHRIPEARAVLERAVAHGPETVLAWTNLVSTYVNEADAPAGEALAREALRRHPGDPILRWNLALLLLEQGKWREGWREYAVRFETPVVARPAGLAGLRRLDDPARLRPGDTVLCHGEQGLGDEILFAGVLGEFVTVAAARGAEVLLAPNPRLAALFARSFGLRAWEGAGAPAPDWLVAIGDLPRFFRNADGDFPRRRGYLAVDPAAVARIRAALGALAPGRPLVGIAWQGGSAYTHAIHRTIPLVEWLPILRRDATFVSLAYHDATAELETLAARHGVTILDVPEITRAADYERTCELVAALDLVITVPTSVLHVAGAVGTRCFVVMDARAAWRECSRDDGVPWYPLSHRRFVRTDRAADWGHTLAAVADSLPRTGRPAGAASPVVDVLPETF